MRGRDPGVGGRSGRGGTAGLPRGGAPPWLVPVAGVAVALALRLWALSFQPWVTADGTEYIRFAESLLHARAFPSIFPPGYSVLIALARLVIWDRVLAAEAVSLVCGALLPWPTWALAKRALGSRWAALPTLAVALHPALALFSAVTMSESAYFLALYGALALAAAARPLGSGLAIGAAFAIRPEALLPAAALVASGGRRPPAGGAAPGPLRHRFRGPARVAAGMLVLAIPCWFYFHATLGEWTLTPKVAAAVREPGKTWVDYEPRLHPRADARPYALFERVARYGPSVLKRAPENALSYGGCLLRVWPAPLLLLSIWGLVRRRGLDAIPLLHLILLPFIVISIQWRFVLGVVPALAILATVPFRAHAGRVPRAIVGAGWIAGAVWCGIANGPDLRLPFDAYLQAQQDAGEWLGGAAEPEARVMDRKPYVAFYAQRPYWVMPDEPYDLLIDAAVREDIRYLVLDQGVVKIFRPQLLPLLYDPKLRERETRLEMVYVGGRVKGFSISIFRVLRPGEPKTGKLPHFDLRWKRLGRAGPGPRPGAPERPELALNAPP